MSNATPMPQTQPQDRRAFSRLTHGLTGARIYIFSEAEQEVFDELCRGFEEFKAQTGAGGALVRAIPGDDFWLRRAAGFESPLRRSRR